MKLQEEIIRFLDKYPGLYTVSMIAEAIDRRPTTALRTALNMLVASGVVSKQTVITDDNRLAWGYVLSECAPKMF